MFGIFTKKQSNLCITNPLPGSFIQSFIKKHNKGGTPIFGVYCDLESSSNQKYTDTIIPTKTSFIILKNKHVPGQLKCYVKEITPIHFTPGGRVNPFVPNKSRLYAIQLHTKNKNQIEIECKSRTNFTKLSKLKNGSLTIVGIGVKSPKFYKYSIALINNIPVIVYSKIDILAKPIYKSPIMFISSIKSTLQMGGFHKTVGGFTIFKIAKFALNSLCFQLTNKLITEKEVNEVDTNIMTYINLWKPQYNKKDGSIPRGQSSFKFDFWGIRANLTGFLVCYAITSVNIKYELSKPSNINMEIWDIKYIDYLFNPKIFRELFREIIYDEDLAQFKSGLFRFRVSTKNLDRRTTTYLTRYFCSYPVYSGGVNRVRVDTIITVSGNWSTFKRLGPRGLRDLKEVAEQLKSTYSKIIHVFERKCPNFDVYVLNPGAIQENEITWLGDETLLKIYLQIDQIDNWSQMHEILDGINIFSFQGIILARNKSLFEDIIAICYFKWVNDYFYIEMFETFQRRISWTFLKDAIFPFMRKKSKYIIVGVSVLSATTFWGDKSGFYFPRGKDCGFMIRDIIKKDQEPRLKDKIIGQMTKIIGRECGPSTNAPARSHDAWKHARSETRFIVGTKSSTHDEGIDDIGVFADSSLKKSRHFRKKF